jgi:arsenite/tail-anchored protein-transporting ATPase
MKILFFTGKGGVGKSTLASASAWQLSQKYRVLIVSLDPAHNLGDIFGVSIRSGKRFSDTLYLKEVDLKKLSKAYLKREINVLSETYKYLQVLNLDNYFSVLKYSPGIEEYALLTSIEETIRAESEFDYIVFDTPPTGLTLRFLALPQVTITWIDRLVQIRRKILEKWHTIYRIRGPQSNQETLLSFDEKDDGILQKLYSLKSGYGSLNAMLQSETCAIVLVLNPDLLSLNESKRLVAGLKELNLPLRLVLHNKIGPGSLETASRVENDIRKAARVPLQRIAFRSEFQQDSRVPLYVIGEDLTRFFEPT